MAIGGGRSNVSGNISSAYAKFNVERINLPKYREQISRMREAITQILG
jgi:hypothetical protein